MNVGRAVLVSEKEGATTVVAIEQIPVEQTTLRIRPQSVSTKKRKITTTSQWN